ncbi:probable G-protein coupled receptor 34b [Lepisosteus oculatus]|uniref:probable G-protein coupled receptor 34b n=1 Tax=Lepisosteus oculatus TaxID=7918 RepID=UPI0035F52FFC
MTSLLIARNESQPYSTITNTSKNDSGCIIDDRALRIPLAVVYSLMFVFGMVGNSLALYVFLFIHPKKNSVRVFLINTAIADLILIICLPFRIVYHSANNQWMLGTVFCKVVGNVFYMNMYISITLLGFISVDRYIKIQRSSKSYKLQRTRWSTRLCCLIWVLSTAAIIPMIVLSEGNETPGKCFHYKHRKYAKGKAYFNVFLIVVFWIVFASLVLSYGKIAKKLYQVSKDKPDLPNAQKYSRTAKKSFFVLFIFTVCFVPYHIFRCVYIWSQISDPNCYWKNIIDKTNEIALLFSAFNSCLDPVMYFLLSGTVRRTTTDLLCLSSHANISTTNSSTSDCRPAIVSQVSTNTRISFSLVNQCRCGRSTINQGQVYQPTQKSLH